MRHMIAADLGLADPSPAPSQRDYPIICMLREEFEALPRYSASYPTGTTPGKRWRRHDGAHDPRARDPKWREQHVRWFVLEYGEISADGKRIGLKWYWPILSREAIASDFGLHD